MVFYLADAITDYFSLTQRATSAPLSFDVEGWLHTLPLFFILPEGTPRRVEEYHLQRKITDGKLPSVNRDFGFGNKPTLNSD